MILYHGSYKKFNNFDFSKIGTGNGKSHNGYGVYLTKEVTEALNYSSDCYENYTFDGVNFFSLPDDYNFCRYLNFKLSGRYIKSFSKRPNEHKIISNSTPDIFTFMQKYEKAPVECKDYILERLKLNLEKINILSQDHEGKIIDFTRNNFESMIREIQSYEKLWCFRSQKFGYIYEVEVDIQENQILDYTSTKKEFTKQQKNIIHNRLRQDYGKKEYNINSLEDLYFYLNSRSSGRNWQKTSMFLYRCGFKGIDGIGLCVIDRKILKIKKVISAKNFYLTEEI